MVSSKTTVVINGIFNTIFFDILSPFIEGLYFLIRSIGTSYKLEIVNKVCFLLTLCSINSMTETGFQNFDLNLEKIQIQKPRQQKKKNFKNSHYSHSIVAGGFELIS